MYIQTYIVCRSHINLPLVTGGKSVVFNVRGNRNSRVLVAEIPHDLPVQFMKNSRNSGRIAGVVLEKFRIE